MCCLLLTNQILNYDRRRQKVPCQTRSESQGSYQRGVQTQEPRQERVFQTRTRADKKAQEIEQSCMRSRKF